MKSILIDVVQLQAILLPAGVEVQVQHEAAFDALALMRGNQTCAVVDAAEVFHQNVDHVVGWMIERKRDVASHRFLVLRGDQFLVDEHLGAVIAIRQLGFGQLACFADMRAVQDVAVALSQFFHRLRNVGFDWLCQGGKRIK